jgi:hypothetical protein
VLPVLVVPRDCPTRQSVESRLLKMGAWVGVAAALPPPALPPPVLSYDDLLWFELAN